MKKKLDFLHIQTKNGKWHEECAVFGVSSEKNSVAGIAYNALLALQHRGQEGSGIAVSFSQNDIYCKKACGLASEVFSDKVLSHFPAGAAAIAHNRYSTTGKNCRENVQPFVTEYLLGRIATCHNGNILNAKNIKENLAGLGAKFDATSDSEVISTLIAYHCVRSGSVEGGIRQAVREIQGAYSLLVLCSDGKIFAVRDPDGFRPLCIGESGDGAAAASESCALDSSGYKFVRDILPGEIVLLEKGKAVSLGFIDSPRLPDGGLCIFEYVYFARPDSVIDGLSVYEARFQMGRTLAKEYPVEADVVVGVPDSGLEAAFGYSAESGIALASGFVKNRYIGRSFIYPSQAQRENAVRLKLNPLAANVKDKRVVLIDDSVVRGTTSRRIVQALKNAGAKEVHLRISAPPFKHACHFGTDIDSEENLLANRIPLEQIAGALSAESIGYISLKGLKQSCAESRRAFCTQCFSGSRHSLRKNDLE